VRLVYAVTVHTSDRRGAGTDANVFVELHGSAGHVGWTRLESGCNDFERGAVDVFKLTGADIGKLMSVGIKHDRSGFGSGWHLNMIEVRNETSGELAMFPCDNWLDDAEGDKKTERQLMAGVSALLFSHYYHVQGGYLHCCTIIRARYVTIDDL
jgi:hypothetical protein